MFVSSFTILSDTVYLKPLREWVEAIARIAGKKYFSKRARVACTLSLIEAVNNAIFHAHKGDREKPISLVVRVRKDGIVMEIEDRGEGIGHHHIFAPDSLENHGRGLFLMHTLMSKVESRKRNGGHLLKLTCKI